MRLTRMYNKLVSKYGKERVKQMTPSEMIGAYYDLPEKSPYHQMSLMELYPEEMKRREKE